MKCKEKLKELMVSRFKPMNEKEQELFHYMLVDCFFELCELFDKAKTKADKRVADVQIKTYTMLINLFEEPAKELKDIGYDNRAILENYVKPRFEEYKGKDKADA